MKPHFFSSVQTHASTEVVFGFPHASHCLACIVSNIKINKSVATLRLVQGNAINLLVYNNTGPL